MASKSDECDLQMEYVLLILYGKGISYYGYYQCETLFGSRKKFKFLHLSDTKSSNNLTYIVGGIRIWRVLNFYFLEISKPKSNSCFNEEKIIVSKYFSS